MQSTTHATAGADATNTPREFPRRRAYRLGAAGAVLTALSLGVLSSPTHAHATTTVSFTAYNIPTTPGGPNAITAGPDGNLWTTEIFAGKIARITPSGVVTEFTVPNSGCLVQITQGPDRNLWFVDLCNNFIGRITTKGHIKEFPVPKDRVLPAWKAQGLGQAPASITVGPDGNLWIAEFATDRIVQLHTNGRYGLDFKLPRHPGLPAGDPDASGPSWITTGADGNLWFTEDRYGGGPLVGNRVARMTLGGVFTEFPVPTPDANPNDIVAGPDGNLWFTEEFGNKIGRVDLNGNMTEFAVPTANATPDQITVGPDGAMWFTEASITAPGLARIDTSGSISEFASPTPPSGTDNFGAVGIGLGPDNNIWFTEPQPNTVIKTIVTG